MKNAEMKESDQLGNTEQLILAAAKRVFLSRGLEGARMQDIADEAGINKALLHYYYRSKQNLYLVIVQEVFNGFFPIIFKTLTAQGDIKTRIENFFDVYIDFLLDHPDLPNFIVTEVSRRPELIENIFKVPKENGVLQHLEESINASIEKGEIRPISARDFIINLISLCVFPILTQPIFMNLFAMSEPEFNVFLSERKKSAAQFFINALQ